MVDNVGRKITLILVLLATAILLLTLQDVRMGLDLAGGTRLVYRLDIEEAQQSGAIGPDESPAKVLDDTIAIIRERVDPQGVTEPVIRKAGPSLIEINLPSLADMTQASASGSVAEDVPATGTAPIRLLPLEGEELRGFPRGGGVVRIGNERIRYSTREGDSLMVAQRGFERSAEEAHAAGDVVVLVSDDAIRNAIENLGDMQFYIEAVDADFQAVGADRATELEKARSWVLANEGVALSQFNRLGPDEGGPPRGIRWFPMALEESAVTSQVADRLIPALVPPEKWVFTGDDLARVYNALSPSGYPAVGLEMKPSARIPFGEFSEENVDELMLIVLNGETVSRATINEPLLGAFQISGRFSQSEVDSQIRVLRSGSLKIKPILQSEERVGATLGAQYVKRGFLSVALGLAAVLVFMIAYYRRLGIFAVVALLANLTLLAGAMAGLQATLTLPGIAGIILTVGMAVDANILIFDRLREEADKGHKVMQAAINGFKNATSAIVDANVTTLITALILMNVGTGPVRGFAVTLSIGILTSVFSALVITRVLVHLQLEKGVTKFSMGSWLANANFDFMSKSRVAMVGSAIVIVAGLGLFFSEDDSDKLGIDFLGGASVKVRTEEGQTPAHMRELVARIPGDIGANAAVASLPASAVGEGRFTTFRITFKIDPGARGDEQGGEETLESEIRAGLHDVLQRGPIDVTLDAGGQEDRAELALYFEEEHEGVDLAAALGAEGSGLSDVQASQRGERRDVFVVSATVSPGVDEAVLRTQVRRALDGQVDSSGRGYSLAQPVPETTVVGRQVVGELRDSAIKAILLSMFLVLLYIRARFAEYSYGWAAIVAVVHDVLVSIGAIALMVALPWVDVEINLPMIAAFLTIVGYSLNDTIVIFDRVRENLPRVKGSLREIVNLSINQTLSRTIMTSVTTLLTLIMLFAFSFGTGSVLEGFSFAMIVGLISGTYSTIFIAAPVFLWLEGRRERKESHGGSGETSERGEHPGKKKKGSAAPAAG